MKPLYAIRSGDGGILETVESRGDAIDARVRWMGGYPDVIIQKYLHVSDIDRVEEGN